MQFKGSKAVDFHMLMTSIGRGHWWVVDFFPRSQLLYNEVKIFLKCLFNFTAGKKFKFPPFHLLLAPTAKAKFIPVSICLCLSHKLFFLSRIIENLSEKILNWLRMKWMVNFQRFSNKDNSNTPTFSQDISLTFRPTW